MIIDVREIPGRETEAPEDTSRRYRRVYRVWSDIMNEPEVNVRFAPGLPRLFTFFPDDLGALCTSVRPRQDTETPFLWEVEVAWSTLSLTSRSANAARSDPSQRNENPLMRPIRISFRSDRRQKAIDRDVFGNAIATSAGVPFDPPFTVEESQPLMLVMRNEAAFSPLVIPQWRNKVNSDTFLAFPPNTVRVVEITSDSAYENGRYFFETQYLFSITDPVVLAPLPDQDTGGWFLRPLDAGYHTKVGGEVAPITFRDGNTPSTPVNLDGNGDVLPPGDPPHYLEYQIYQNANFADLGLF